MSIRIFLRERVLAFVGGVRRGERRGEGGGEKSEYSVK
jgi:hypothetical protein